MFKSLKKRRQIALEARLARLEQLMQVAVAKQPLTSLLVNRVNQVEEMLDVDRDDPELFKQYYIRNLYFMLKDTETDALEAVWKLMVDLKQSMDAQEDQTMCLAVDTIRRYISMREHVLGALMPVNPLEL